MSKTQEDFLAYSVDYRIDFMDVHGGSGFQQVPGMIVQIIENDRDIAGIPLGDDYNTTRLLAIKGAQIIGRGVLIERVSWYWFVAWRPYSPEPKIDHTKMER